MNVPNMKAVYEGSIPRLQNANPCPSVCVFVLPGVLIRASPFCSSCHGLPPDQRATQGLQLRPGHYRVS